MASQLKMEGMVSGRLHLSPLTDSSNKTLMDDPAIIGPEPKKPVPGPKPRLTPKPFTTDRNLVIRPILAPKPQPKPKPESLPRPEPPHKPKPLTKPSPEPPAPDAPAKPKPAEGASVARRTSLGPSAAPASSRVVSISRAKSMGILSGVGIEEDGGDVVLRPQDGRSSRPRPVSAVYSSNPASPPSATTHRTDRRPLSSELTSKFESSLQRRPATAESKENTPETPAQDETRARTKEEESNEAKPLEKTGSGIKRRISLLIDSSSVSHSPPATRGAEPRSPAPPITDTDGAVGVKQRIRELTEDFATAATPPPPQKPHVKPRPLHVDLNKRSVTESPGEAEDLHKKDAFMIGQPKTPEDVRSQDVPDSPQSSSSFHTVRASLFDNVVEKHSVQMLEDGSSEPPAAYQRGAAKAAPRRSFSLRIKADSRPAPMEDNEDGSLVMATYQKVVTPTSPKRMDHIFDTFATVEGSRARSEIVPSAHLEEKALTLRARRSDAGERVQKPDEESGSTVWPSKEKDVPAMDKSAPRFLRVGALPKWDETHVDRDGELEKKRLHLRNMEEELQRQIKVHMAARADIEDEEDETEAESKTPDVDQYQATRQKATYFALTGQINETVHQAAGLDEEVMFGGIERGRSDIRTKPDVQFDDFSIKAARRSLPSRGASVRLNPEEPPKTECQDRAEWSRGQVKEREHRRAMEEEFERQRLAKMKKQRDAEQKELERQQQRELEMQRELERQKELERQMELERQLEKQRELERQKLEMQRELERQKLEMQRELERQKELERQMELERQLEKQRELERQKLEMQRELERQKELERQMELERQKLEMQRELERQKLEMQRELERQKELERQMELERQLEKQRELERQLEKQRELERQLEKQRELERQLEKQRELERQLEMQRELERQKEMQRELERQKELERQRQLERQKQLDKERQQQLEYEKRKAAERELEQQREYERRRQKEYEREKERILEQEMLRIRECEKQRERERQLELDRQRELERIKDLERQEEMKRQKELEQQREMERRTQLERQKAEEREKQRVLEDLKKFQEMERRQLSEYKLQKDNEREKPARQWTEKQEDLQRASERDKRSSESPLRPKVLDLDAVSLGDPRLRQPSNLNDEPYRPSILDVDSFRNQTQPAASSDPFGMNVFSSPDSAATKPASQVRPQSILQNLQNLHAHPHLHPAEPPRLPALLQPQVVHQPQPQASVTPDYAFGTCLTSTAMAWSTFQTDMWGSSSREEGVDEPLWTSSMENSRKFNTQQSSLEKLLQRQEERGIVGGFSTPTAFAQTPTSSYAASPGQTLTPESVFMMSTDGGSAGSLNLPTAFGSTKENQTVSSTLPEPMWNLNWDLESQELDQTQQRNNGSPDLSRIRSRSINRRSAPAETSVDGPLARLRSRSAHRDRGLGAKEQIKQDARGQQEHKDTDTLVQETDSQYGTWDTGPRTDDSISPVTPSLDSSLTPSPRKQSTHTPEEQAAPLAFPQSSTSLLDSSVQHSKIQLSKSCRRRRAPPSRAARLSAVIADGIEQGTEDWRFKDTTEDKPDGTLQDEDSEEEEPSRDSRTPTIALSQPQRVSLFPGVDPAALMAQLKKRGEAESQSDGSSSAQLSRSPKSPYQPRASRVLPPSGGNENGEESPAWLKELKTKKRFSQIENDG